MYQKLSQNATYAKKMSSVRSKTVESVIGMLMNFTNMKRMNTRGTNFVKTTLYSFKTLFLNHRNISILNAH
ncbi:MAG: hypothetical protein R2798_12425 [Chitinophagales bacterium]|nr:hypothetical protein [Bacteroidota bacterium]MCB9043054.1 hypothetical protein [Chitinophagales bacterium]